MPTYIAHGPCSLAGFLSIGTRLGVLAPTPRNLVKVKGGPWLRYLKTTHDISRTSLCLFRKFVCLGSIPCGRLHQSQGRFEDPAHIMAGVGSYSRQDFEASFSSKVRFLDLSLCGVLESP